jgi:radical SAM superfamily enzyme YgiQ (UPF0313 family)
MKIALINASGRYSSDGSRLISALLKRAGHSVKTVLLAGKNPLVTVYESGKIELLHEILKDVDLVMLAVYSNFAFWAIQVTEFIRKRYPGMKVIWGGPHCISAPELSIPYADGVCFAEGDQIVVDLIAKIEAGADYLSTPNMAFNVNGTYVKNGVVPPFSDLESLPYPDYDLDDQFLLDDHQLLQLTKENVKKYCGRFPLGMPTFYIMTSRGCPHNCSYCNNCRYIALFGRNPMRFRSVDNFMGELEYVMGFLDFFEGVSFADDDFLIRPTKELEDFAEKYKKKIGLPFSISASANTSRKEKVELLLDAGLKLIQIGVQSGSQRVLDDVYNRKISVATTKEVVRKIEPHIKTHGLELVLDFIVDNPYETKADLFETYQYLLDVSPHIKLNMHALAFFPGTPIYERAIKDGFIQPLSKEAFRTFNSSQVIYQKNYETFLAMLISFHLTRRIPNFLLHALGSQPVRRIASLFPTPLYGFLISIVRKIKHGSTLLRLSYLRSLSGKIRKYFPGSSALCLLQSLDLLSYCLQRIDINGVIF